MLGSMRARLPRAWVAAQARVRPWYLELLLHRAGVVTLTNAFPGTADKPPMFF